MDYEFLGIHYIASFNACMDGTIGNIKNIKEKMIEAVNASGATILGTVEHVFKNQLSEGDGFTIVLLLSESHASIHTYPEKKSCFIDLFTCGTKCSYKHFDKILREYFQPSNVCCKIIQRNDSVLELSQ